MGFFGMGSTLIDAHTLPGQTEGLRVGCGGMGGGVGWLRRDGWFAKVDNRFGYEIWI